MLAALHDREQKRREEETTTRMKQKDTAIYSLMKMSHGTIETLAKLQGTTPAVLIDKKPWEELGVPRRIYERARVDADA